MYGIIHVSLQREALKVPQHGEWWTGSFQTPKLAGVLDFVFSDASRKVWDNNKNKDYHVQIQGALSKEQLIQVCFAFQCILVFPSHLTLYVYTRV